MNKLLVILLNKNKFFLNFVILFHVHNQLDSTNRLQLCIIMFSKSSIMSKMNKLDLNKLVLLRVARAGSFLGVFRGRRRRREVRL